MTKHEDKPSMRVLKTATCKSITGKSTLTYQIGCTPDSTVHIRISKNTGKGFFNPEWIKIEDVRKALAKGPKGQPLTSFLLQSLFEGRSSNSPGFMLAALTHERLLRVLKGKKRGHELLDPEGFTDRMDRLASSGAKAKGTTGGTTKRPTKKTGGNTGGSTGGIAVKKKSISRRKTSKTG